MEETFLAVEKEVTPETGAKYDEALIVLPCGSTFDISLYDINCTHSLKENAIARSMYAECNPDMNEYVLKEEFVDIKCMDDDLALVQHQITVNDKPCQCKMTKVWFNYFR